MLKVQPTSFNQVSFQKGNADMQAKIARTEDLMDEFGEQGFKSEKVQEAVTNVATSDKAPKLLKFFLYAAASSVVAFFGGKLIMSKGVKIIDNPKLGWLDNLAEKTKKGLGNLPNKKIFQAPEEGAKGMKAITKGLLNKAATKLSNFDQKVLDEKAISGIKKDFVQRLSGEMNMALKESGAEGVVGVIKKYSPRVTEEQLEQIQRSLSSTSEETITKTLGTSVNSMAEALTEKEQTKGAIRRIAGNVAGGVSALVTGAKTIINGDKDNDGALDSEEIKGTMISKALKLLGEDGVLDNFLA